MSIRWDEFEPQKYEDMVSVLLGRLHADAQRIDGKGGDGGRDVQIVQGLDGLLDHAFELKSFTGRMTESQRGQVARSLKRAAALGPARWTLVVPIDPTPAEDKWFRKLGAGYGFPIAWLGKTWLDGKMSAFPDVRRYFVEGAKDEVYQLLLELREEDARIIDVHGAVARLRTLRKRLNEIDPYYRYEMSTVTAEANRWPPDVALSVLSGDVRIDVYPKYSGATKDRPITMTVMVALEPEDLVIQESLGYGLEVTIPSRMISSITIDAPFGLGATFTESELKIVPLDTKLDEPVTITLDIMDGDKIIASCPVHLTEQTGGPKGSIFNGTDSTGWLETRLTVKLVEQEVECQFRLNPKPAMPAALVPLFRWLDACQPPRHIKIRWREGFEIHSEVNRPIVEDGFFGRLVEALAYLQDRSGIYCEMPSSLSHEEAQEVVNSAALMRGEIVTFNWNSFNLNLHRWGPEFNGIASGATQQFIMEHETSLRLEGVEIPIGRIRTHIPSARLADPESVQRDLASGSVPSLRLVPGDSYQGQRVLVS